MVKPIETGAPHLLKLSRSSTILLQSAARRLTALFLCLLILSGIIIPPVSVYAETTAADNAATTPQPPNPPSTAGKPVIPKPNHTVTPPDTTTKMKQDYAGALPVVETSTKPAADYVPKPKTRIPGMPSTETAAPLARAAPAAPP